MNEREKYRKKINKVMDAWKSTYDIKKEGFYEDGIVCEDEWFKDGNTFRPMFLLKDVNESGAPECISFIHSNDILKGFELESYTWRKLALLAEGLYILDSKQGSAEYAEHMEYVCIKRWDEKRYSPAINRVAIMNLKKSAGNNMISDADLLSHIKKTKSLSHIIDEIEAISPTVIICCGTYDVCKALGITDNIKHSRKMIAALHPRARKRNSVFYNDTLRAYADILER